MARKQFNVNGSYTLKGDYINRVTATKDNTSVRSGAAYFGKSVENAYEAAKAAMNAAGHAVELAELEHRAMILAMDAFDKAYDAAEAAESAFDDEDDRRWEEDGADLALANAVRARSAYVAIGDAARDAARYAAAAAESAAQAYARAASVDDTGGTDINYQTAISAIDSAAAARDLLNDMKRLLKQGK